MERLTVKICLNGKELCEFDMGTPRPDVDFKETLRWYTAGHVKATEKFFPYYASIGLTRPDNKEVRRQMEELVSESPH